MTRPTEHSRNRSTGAQGGERMVLPIKAAGQLGFSLWGKPWILTPYFTHHTQKSIPGGSQSTCERQNKKASHQRILEKYLHDLRADKDHIKSTNIKIRLICWIILKLGTSTHQRTPVGERKGEPPYSMSKMKGLYSEYVKNFCESVRKRQTTQCKNWPKIPQEDIQMASKSTTRYSASQTMEVIRIKTTTLPPWGLKGQKGKQDNINA